MRLHFASLLTILISEMCVYNTNKFDPAKGKMKLYPHLSPNSLPLNSVPYYQVLGKGTFSVRNVELLTRVPIIKT